MLASGQKRTHFTAPFYDCFPLKADIRQREWHVRYVPKADIPRGRLALSVFASELPRHFRYAGRQRKILLSACCRQRALQRNRVAHQIICMARFNAAPSIAISRTKMPADFGS